MKTFTNFPKIGGVLILLLALLPVFLWACQRKEDNVREEVKKMTIQVTSPAFMDGGSIPKEYTCDGADISPPLSWEKVPQNTKSIALICDDPDAPVGTWDHWVIYGLSPDSTSLPRGVAADKVLPDGARQGINDFRKIGYGGPCPPRGSAHRYYFKVYALDIDVELEAGATKKELLKAMDGHIIAEGQLIGKYKR